MDTLENITSNLTNIANSYNFSGVVAQAEINLLANSIYLNELHAISTVLEASPSRCTKINSAIKHAYDSQYSVPRGTNQHITLKNIIPLKSKSVKKFDLMAKAGKHNLYYAQDYDFIESVTPSEVEVILGDKVVSETLTSITTGSNPTIYTPYAIYLSSNSSDISEDYALYKFSEIQEVSSYFSEFGVTCDYFVITDTDYSIDIYYKEPFTNGNEYSIKFIPYLPESIDPNIITSIPDFNVTSSQITSVDYIPRLESNEVIMYNSMVYKRSSYVIRSKSDIEDLVRAYFPTEIAGVQVTIDNTVTVEHPSGVIYIYYLMENLSTSLSEDRINAFKTAIKKAYYVLQDVEFVKAQEVDIDLTKDRINLLIYYSTMLKPETINSISVGYSYNIGVDFNTYELIADLTRGVSGINYINIIPSTEEITSIVNYPVPTGKYMPIEKILRVTYESTPSSR